MARITFGLLLLFPQISSAAHYFEIPTPGLYEVPITPPACDYTINEASDWSIINTSRYRVFCVAPGDYTSAGPITLTADGTSGNERWIRYHNPSISDEIHPYHMDSGDRAIIQRLDFDNADYWVVDRITIHADSSYASYMHSDSDHNVINRIDAYNFKDGITMYNGSDYNVVQNSTLHDQIYSDRVAIAVFGWDNTGPSADPQFTRILNNEIWDVGDGIQLVAGDSTGEDYRGTVVYNNDIYLTAGRYTDCSGNLTPTGSCACAENAIDLKSGSEDSKDPVLIQQNRMWGYRKSDVNCHPTWDDPGVGMVVHYDVNNTEVSGHIIWNSQRNFSWSHGAIGSTVSGNLFHSPYGHSGNTGVQIYTGNAGPAPRSLTYDGNVFVDSNAEDRRFGALNYADMAFSNNILIDNGSVSGNPRNVSFSGNRYFDSIKPFWDTNPATDEPLADASGYTDFCFEIKHITAPETLCLPHALPPGVGNDDAAPQDGGDVDGEVPRPDGGEIAGDRDHDGGSPGDARTESPDHVSENVDVGGPLSGGCSCATTPLAPEFLWVLIALFGRGPRQFAGRYDLLRARGALGTRWRQI